MVWKCARCQRPGVDALTIGPLKELYHAVVRILQGWRSVHYRARCPESNGRNGAHSGPSLQATKWSQMGHEDQFPRRRLNVRYLFS